MDSLVIKGNQQLTAYEQKTIVELICECFGDPIEMAEDMVMSMRQLPYVWFMIKKDNKIVSMAALSYTNLSTKDILSQVATKPIYQGQGYMRIVLNELIKFYEEHKEQLKTPLVLTVDNNKDDTERLITIYQRFNFAISECTDTQVVMTYMG